MAVISNCVGVAIGSWMMSDLMASSTLLCFLSCIRRLHNTYSSRTGLYF